MLLLATRIVVVTNPRQWCQRIERSYQLAFKTVLWSFLRTDFTWIVPEKHSQFKRALWFFGVLLSRAKMLDCTRSRMSTLLRLCVWFTFFNQIEKKIHHCSSWQLIEQSAAATSGPNRTQHVGCSRNQVAQPRWAQNQCNTLLPFANFGSNAGLQWARVIRVIAHFKLLKRVNCFALFESRLAGQGSLHWIECAGRL